MEFHSYSSLSFFVLWLLFHQFLKPLNLGTGDCLLFEQLTCDTPPHPPKKRGLNAFYQKGAKKVPGGTIVT